MVKTKPDNSRKGSTSSARRTGGTANMNKMAAQVNTNNEVESTDDTTCPKCGKDVDEEGIMCDRGCCKSWWHLKCGNVNKSEYAAMKSGKRSLMWFCENCIDDTEAFVKNTNKIDSNMSKTIVDKLDILTAKVDSLSGLTERVSKLEKAIASEERALDQVIDMKLENKLKELEDKEKRKENLVLYNVKESENDDVITRIEKEGKKVIAICTYLDINPDCVAKKMYRLGKRVPGKTRPLKIHIKDDSARNKILSNAKTLKDCPDEKLKIIYILKDLTFKERDQNRQLVEKMKLMRSEGKQVKIYRGKIVDIQNQRLDEEDGEPKA